MFIAPGNRKRYGGFTLLEIMLVVSIIMLLLGAGAYYIGVEAS
jgi:type II secretory pathway pseudopilin PulG